MQFTEALRRVSVRGIWDMGLVVAKEEKKEKIAEELKNKTGNAEIFRFVKELSPEEFLEALVEALKNEKWLITVLNGGKIDGKIYGALRRLSTSNRLQILHFKNEGELNLKQPPESRIVFVASRRDIEKLDLPEFIKLFGPVLDLAEKRGVE